MHRFQRTMMNIKRLQATSSEGCTPLLTVTDMPHPKSLPMLGTWLEFMISGGGAKLHEYIDSRHKQLGPIFAERLAGSRELVFVSDPLFMKTLFINMEGKYPIHILPEPWVMYEKLYGSQRGLFFMNGENWLHNRRILNKHLLKDSIEEWISTPIKECVRNFIMNMKEKAQSGVKVIDFEKEFYRLSTNVLVSVLLGKNSLHQSRHYDEMITMFSDSVKRIFQSTTKLYGLPLEWCQYFNIKVWRDFKECVDLSLRLAKKMAFEILKNKDMSDGLIKKLTQEHMSNEMITRIVADFIIAAGDTTAYTTVWIFMLLCKNDEVIREIRTKDQTYVKFVIKEAMRMYPVAPFLTRILPKEIVYENYVLGEGTPIIASIYTSGRDEHNYSMPNLFLPYRWDRQDPRRQGLDNHVSSASLPFAMGTRSCIGKKIALFQLTEVVSQIINNFDVKCTNCEGMKALTSQVLVPDRQLEFVVNVRDKESVHRV